MAEGHLKCDLFEGMMKGFVKNRQVAHLCPHAELAEDFTSGRKKLIPGIFCHGFSFSAEDHFAVPMMMASHGYLYVSPTFMDGSAAHTKD